MKHVTCPPSFAWLLVLTSLSLANAPAVGAWTSAKAAWSDDVHQNAIRVVLHPFFNDQQLNVLETQQQVIDRDQEADQSDEHSMTGVTSGSQNESQLKTQYIQRTEQLLRTHFTAAVAARKKGDTNGALLSLAKTIHALEDATSPVHRGFQPWKDSFGIWEMAKHVLKERTYPVDDSTHFYKVRLEGVVRYAYDIYMETVPIPAQFFDQSGCLLRFDPNCLTR